MLLHRKLVIVFLKDLIQFLYWHTANLGDRHDWRRSAVTSRVYQLDLHFIENADVVVDPFGGCPPAELPRPGEKEKRSLRRPRHRRGTWPRPRRRKTVIRPTDRRGTNSHHQRQKRLYCIYTHTSACLGSAKRHVGSAPRCIGEGRKAGGGMGFLAAITIFHVVCC